MPNRSGLAAPLASLCVSVTYQQSLRTGCGASDAFSSVFWTDVLGLDFALKREGTVVTANVGWRPTLVTLSSTKVTCIL